MTDAGTGHRTLTLARVGTFIKALNMFQPAIMCMVGSSFAMRRFGYDNEAVAIFVAFCSNAMELLYMYATLSVFTIVTIIKVIVSDYFIYIISGMSMISSCFTVIVNALLLKTYAIDNGIDNVTRYYWFLLLANFATGMEEIFLVTINADDIAPFELGFALIGLLVAAFHWIVIRILDCCNMDVDYWLIVSQLVLTVSLSILSALLWMWYVIRYVVPASGKTGNKRTEGKQKSYNTVLGYLKVLPMIIATSVSLGTLWAIYPLVSPFEIVQFEYQHPIQCICLVFHAFAGLVLLLTDEYVGIRYDWYSGVYAWWHLTWLLLVPYIGIAVWFIRCMHFPDSPLGRLIFRKPLLVGPLTILYFTLSRYIYGISNVVVDANSEGQGAVVAPFNRVLSNIAMNILKYMSEAHVQNFRQAKNGIKDGKPWPTDGMSDYSAIRYWLKLSVTVGYANFRDMSSADVKQRLSSVPRRKSVYGFL